MLDMSTTAQIKDSLKLGGALLGEIGNVGNLHKRNVEQAGFAVLKAPDIPSVLVETAFISNPEEERRLRSDDYQEQLADAIMRGIHRYFANNPPLARNRPLKAHAHRQGPLKIRGCHPGLDPGSMLARRRWIAGSSSGMTSHLGGQGSRTPVIAGLSLRSQAGKLYHAGIHGSISRSTLADANERRDCRIFEDFALHLIDVARALYGNDSLSLELEQSVYAIDASTIELCLGLFKWAPAANAKAGIKLHTMLDLRGSIPTVVRITPALVSDASFLDDLPLEAGSFYVMDRGYIHFARLIRFTHAAAFFVIRSMDKLKYKVVSNRAVDQPAILSDAHILMSGKYTQVDYPLTLRRIEFFDTERDRVLTFLTNHFELQASQIASLYKSRWQVELFFKWIKQNLRIKAFVGNSTNAVKTQSVVPPPGAYIGNRATAPETGAGTRGFTRDPRRRAGRWMPDRVRHDSHSRGAASSPADKSDRVDQRVEHHLAVVDA